MLKKNVETFLECDKNYEEAEVILFGAPFDSTTSLPFRGRDLAAAPFAMNLSDWRVTVRIRIVI